MWVAYGRVTLDFYNNDNSKLKKKSIEELCKTLKKEFNLSALEVADFDDLEKCTLGFSMVMPETWTEKSAENFVQKLQKRIDEEAFGRVSVEEWDLLSPR